MAAQELGTQHRRKRKRAKRRKEHRTDHHRHELAEKEARGTAQRKHRHEYRHQHHRGRNDREEDFVRPRDSGLLGRHAAFNLVVNVFHNHDGVVDHEADSQDHRKQGQHVDTEPAQVKHEEASDNSNRHHHHRDKRRAALTEEGEDNPDHQQERNKHRLHHFLDGGADVDGSIAAVQQLHAFGNLAADVLDAPVEFVGDFHVVGTGLRHERDRNGRLAVAPEARTRILRFIMDVRHVRDADDRAVRGRLDRNVFKSLRVENAAQRTDRKRRFATFDTSGRQFEVTLAEGGRHLGTGHAQCLHAHRINPEAHRRALFTPDSHFRDARNRLQAFLHVVVREFRDFHRVELIAHEAHYQNRVRIAVGLVYGRFVHVVGEPAAHAAHAVTDFVRGRFQVHARLEFNADVREAVAARRCQRLDARSAVDGGFQDFGDFGFHHGGVRARIRSTHLNKRVVDVRVFAHAQVHGTERPEQDNHERHHGHEDRAAYG